MIDLRELERFCDAAAHLKVLVIGETIIDEFVSVQYEGQSMKSMCPVLKLENEVVRQHGGAEAIANHLRGFVKSVEMITNEKDEIVKTRYMDINDAKKHVEINKFITKSFPKCEILGKSYDLVICADFGHGFFDNITLENGFHLMCQTNSNNFGFNRISKWKKYRKKSVCLDLREASLQMNRRINFPKEHEIFEIFNYEINSDCMFVTTGKEGACYTDGASFVKQDSFKAEIVDTIGAGDTFFAFASLCSSLPNLGNPLLIPSLAASLSTTWLCNEQSVTKEKLINHAARYL